MTQISQILSAIEHGDPHAAEQLLPLVYAELRQLAAQRLAAEKPGQTLQATALVHEAYLRLVAVGGTPAARGQHWNSRGHFFAAAAEAMRRILVENARRKRSRKHGGGRQRIDLADADPGYLANDDEVLAVNDALEQLAAEDPQAARLVQLRYFGGLSVEEAAEHLGIARSTAYEHWAYARASLRLKLGAGADTRPSEE
jgi:RNA polymerase sigma factor (TIGR02999 family)